MPILVLAAWLLAPAFAQDAAPPKLTEMQQKALKSAEPLDWSKLAAGDADVVYIGEFHPIKSAKAELAAHLEDFKKAGFTHLALEMFRKDKQQLLDDFCKDGSCAKDVGKNLDAEWCWRDATGAYLELLEKARKLGFKLVALDVALKDQEAWFASAIKHADTAGEMDGHIRAILSRRDGQMASAIADVFRDDPKARVVAYVGVYHAQFTTQPAALEQWDIPLKEGGSKELKTRGYCFINVPAGLQLAWGRPLLDANLAAKRSFIPLERERSDWKTFSECDGMLVVPKVLIEEPSKDPELLRCAP